jgi:hypothetical protein
MRFKARRLVVNLAAVAALAPGALLHAQSFPAKPVRIIVPFPAGGPSDLLTRMMAPKLTEIWSQQITVDNRPGAGTIIGTEIGAKAPPDGYTIALVSTWTRDESGPAFQVAIRHAGRFRARHARHDAAHDHRRASVVRRPFVQGIHRARQSEAR